MTDQRADYDNPWKEAIAIYFKSLIAFFFPEIHEQIDWTRGYSFLDFQLRQVMRDDEIGRRDADKLVKVWRLDGIETFVLIHLEIQSQVESGFAERMYVYNSRIFGLYRKPVVSLAVLADDQNSWRPAQYDSETWGCRVLLEFPVVKLLDYQSQWSTLESSTNPFAAIVMAHLKTQATRHNSQDRLQWKVRIAKSLYQRGYNRSEVRELFRLIDWMMTLPKDLESGFRQEIQRYEEESKMRYITSIERLEREEGIEIGILRKGREDIIEILDIRFRDVPSELVDTVNQIADISQLKTLLRQAVTIGAIAEFQQLIEQLTSEATEGAG